MVGKIYIVEVLNYFKFYLYKDLCVISQQFSRQKVYKQKRTMVKEILKKDSEEKKFIILKSKFVYTGVFIPEKEMDDFYVIIDKFGDKIVLNKSSIEIIKKFKEVEDR